MPRGASRARDEAEHDIVTLGHPEEAAIWGPAQSLMGSLSGIVGVNWREPPGEVFLSLRRAQSLSLFQQFAQGDPPHGDALQKLATAHGLIITSTATATLTPATYSNRTILSLWPSGVNWRPERLRPAPFVGSFRFVWQCHHLVTTIPLSRRSLSVMQFPPSPNDLSRNRPP